MPSSIPYYARTLGIILVVACASPSPDPEPAPGPAPTRSNSDVITQAELADPALVGSSLLEAIAHLRPRFLNQRGGGLGRSERVQISVDGANPIPASELGRIEIASVAEIRYLSTTDAGLRFGLKGSMGPVLLISLRQR